MASEIPQIIEDLNARLAVLKESTEEMRGYL
jgi:hypothetical protein